MRIQHKIIAPHRPKQNPQIFRLRPSRIILPQHQLLTIRRLHPLIVIFQPRQLHPHRRQNHRPHNRKHQRHKHQRMRHMPHPRQHRNPLAQRPQQRQKRHQSQNRPNKTLPQSLHRSRKTHRILLNPLRSPLHLPHPMPICLIIFRHRRTPTKNVMLTKKIQQNRQHNRYPRNLRKHQQFSQKLRKRNRIRRLQNILNPIIKHPKPLINLHIQFHLEPNRSQNHHRPNPSPALPFPIQKETTKHKIPAIIKKAHILTKPNPAA